jgi:hypothetical protein
LRVEVENCGIYERCDAFSNFQIIKLSNYQILKSSNLQIITSSHHPITTSSYCLFKRWKILLLAPVAAASFYRRRASAAVKRYSGKRVGIFGEARFHLLLMTGIFP